MKLSAKTCLLFVVCLAFATLAQVGQAARLALVIGNDSYAHVEKLRNARADARALAQTLESAGFRVTLLLDQDRAGMQAGLRRFKAAVAGGDEAVFFYAGHGVELGGTNYLLPTDIRDDNDDQLQDDAVSLQRVLSLLVEQKPRLSLVIIDACRDDPFRGKGRNVGTRGLVPATAANGQMVIYSAGAGQRALDRLGDSDTSANSVFTRVLVREIERGGQPVHEVVRSVRQEVARLAASVGHEQVPAFYDQAIGDFYFKRGDGARQVPGALADADAAHEQDLWLDAKRLDTVQAYEAYLDAYPSGRFAPMARTARRKLAMPAAPPPDPVQAGPAPGAFRDCAECPDMVALPAGSFTMGSPQTEAGRDSDEGPIRTVRVAGFALGRTEVTRGQFRHFARATGRAPSGCWVRDGDAWKENPALDWETAGVAQTDDHPVVCVNYDDAQAYVAWLSSRTGKTYRLPTEAEWEYAARAGTRSVRPWGDGASEACRHANVADQSSRRKYRWGLAFECDDGYAEAAPVGRFRANGFGLNDMLGNVLEWTHDCYVGNYAGAPTDATAVAGPNCSRRVIRGGSWIDRPDYVRSADRFGDSPVDRIDYVGFRVARKLP